LEAYYQQSIDYLTWNMNHWSCWNGRIDFVNDFPCHGQLAITLGFPVRQLQNRHQSLADVILFDSDRKGWHGLHIYAKENAQVTACTEGRPLSSLVCFFWGGNGSLRMFRNVVELMRTKAI
jgi:hypothetical protein